jgi:hypothetical protein
LRKENLKQRAPTARRNVHMRSNEYCVAWSSSAASFHFNWMLAIASLRAIGDECSNTVAGPEKAIFHQPDQP